MFRETDVQLFGEECFDSNPEIFDAQQIETIKNKLSLIHNGFIVHVTDVKSQSESGDFVNLKVVLSSSVNGMPVWGDVQLKITKQAAAKFRNMIPNNKDVFVLDEYRINFYSQLL